MANQRERAPFGKVFQVAPLVSYGPKLQSVTPHLPIHGRIVAPLERAFRVELLEPRVEAAPLIVVLRGIPVPVTI